MVPGRLVVIALLYGASGLIAILLGLGPLVRPAGAMEQLFAAVSIVAGLALEGVSLGLLWRPGRRRSLGLAGGAVLLMLGLLIMILGGISLEECPDDNGSACTGTLVTVVAGGLAVALFGIISMVALNRLRPSTGGDRGKPRRQ